MKKCNVYYFEKYELFYKNKIVTLLSPIINNEYFFVSQDNHSMDSCYIYGCWDFFKILSLCFSFLSQTKDTVVYIPLSNFKIKKWNNYINQKIFIAKEESQVKINTLLSQRKFSKKHLIKMNFKTSNNDKNYEYDYEKYRFKEVKAKLKFKNKNGILHFSANSDICTNITKDISKWIKNDEHYKSTFHFTYLDIFTKDVSKRIMLEHLPLDWFPDSCTD